MTITPLSNPAPDSERARLQAFAARLDAIKARVESQLGGDDVAHVQRVRAFSRRMEWTGRLLVHFSFEPVSYFAGVAALWLHKQVEATEIGHTALHGAYDHLAGAEAFRAEGFAWKVPIDEESWHFGHNVKHHGHTNIAGKDPDLNFGPIRLTPRTPHRTSHYVQAPWALAVAAGFIGGMNLHFTGVVDALEPVDKREAWKKAMRKYVPYYGREYVLFPLLAGPFFPKVLFANWLTELIRDLYSAATIFCGHIGEETADYPEGTRARGRAEWYRMQAEAANNFEVPELVSILCGGLDRQIEHHLFPRFPPNRLREIAPEVRAACEEAGVAYRTASWGASLRGVAKRLWRLSFPLQSTEASKPGLAAA